METLSKRSTKLYSAEIIVIVLWQEIKLKNFFWDRKCLAHHQNGFDSEYAIPILFLGSSDSEQFRSIRKIIK